MLDMRLGEISEQKDAMTAAWVEWKEGTEGGGGGEGVQWPRGLESLGSATY